MSSTQPHDAASRVAVASDPAATRTDDGSTDDRHNTGGDELPTNPEELNAKINESISAQLDAKVESAKHNLYSLFASNRTDLMLLGGYNSIIIYLDAGSDPAEPWKCTVGQHVCSWLVYVAVLVIYLFRHYHEISTDFARVKHKVKKAEDERVKTVELLNKVSKIAAGSMDKSRSGSPFKAIPVTRRQPEQLFKERQNVWIQLLKALTFALFLLCMHDQPISCAIGKGDLKDLKFVQASTLVVLSMAASAVLASLDDKKESEAEEEEESPGDSPA